MSPDTAPVQSEPRVFYLAVAALPTNFERVAEWSEVILADHPHMLEMRGLIDCSRLPIDQQPPTLEYLSGLAAAIEPLMRAATRTRCAVLVPHRPWLWRARLFESITSGSRVAFRAFQNLQEAMLWLHEDAGASVGHLGAG